LYRSFVINLPQGYQFPTISAIAKWKTLFGVMSFIVLGALRRAATQPQSSPTGANAT